MTATPTILILDDSPVLARHLQAQLAALGHTASTHADPASLCGIEADLIFVELLQATGNGFQLLRTLARSHACPLVLLTGTGRSSDHHWGLHAGAAAVLRRPIEPAALRQCLQDLGLTGRCPAGARHDASTATG